MWFSSLFRVPKVDSELVESYRVFSGALLSLWIMICARNDDPFENLFPPNSFFLFKKLFPPLSYLFSPFPYVFAPFLIYLNLFLLIYAFL